MLQHWKILGRHVLPYHDCSKSNRTESTVIPAIKTGQITGTKDLFGERKITVRIAVKGGSIDNDYPQQQYAPPDETNARAEIAEFVRDAGDSLRQSFDEKDHQDDDQYQQPERSQYPFTG